MTEAVQVALRPAVRTGALHVAPAEGTSGRVGGVRVCSGDG